ncbi:MAG: hypothetical protein ACYDA3_12700 [Gaiellaceae bacterium]
MLTGLLPHILAAFGVGLVVATLLWGAGLAVVDVVAPSVAGSVAPALVFAYPCGLVVVFAASAFLLVSPVVAAFVLPVALAAVAVRLILRRRALVNVFTAIRGPLLIALPCALALVLVTGTTWHGPTRTLGAKNPGDVSYYVSHAAAALSSILPYRDLLALGRSEPYVESGTALLAAAGTQTSHVDLFLFYTVSIITSFVLSLAIGLAILARSRSRNGAAHNTPSLLTLSALSAGALFTASWFVESVGESLALPIALSLLAIAWYELEPRLLAVGATAGGVALALTKALAVPALMAVVAVALWRHRSCVRSRATVAYLVVAGALVTGVGIENVLRTAAFYLNHPSLTFTPWDAVRGIGSNPAWLSASEFSLDLLELALLVFLARRREWELFAALAVMTAVLWLNGTSSIALQAGLIEVIAAIVFVVALRPPAFRSERVLLAAAAVLAVVNAWYRDYIETRTSMIVLLLVGATVVASTVAASGDVPKREWRRLTLPFALALTGTFSSHVYLGLLAAAVAAIALSPAAAPHLPRSLRAATLASVCVASLLVAIHAARLHDLRVASARTNLTPEDYAAWRAVATTVPRDGLVFVRIDPYDILSYYPAVAERQLYIGGAKYGLALLDPRELKRREAINDAVLRGRRRPANVTGASRFHSFYALVPDGEQVPTNFARVYANSTWSLYRIA